MGKYTIDIRYTIDIHIPRKNCSQVKLGELLKAVDRFNRAFGSVDLKKPGAWCVAIIIAMENPF
jgi:hypothetical protein